MSEGSFASLLGALAAELLGAVAQANAPVEELLAAGAAMSPVDQELFLGTAYDSQLRLQRYLLQIIDVAAAERGELRLFFQPIDLTQTLRVFARELGAIAERSDAIVIEAAGPATVYADRRKLEMLFIPLLVDAVRRSSLPVRIVIHTGEDNVAIEIHRPAAEPSGALALTQRVAEEYARAHRASFIAEPTRATLRFLTARDHLPDESVDDAPASDVDLLQPWQTVDLATSAQHRQAILAAGTEEEGPATGRPVGGTVLVVCADDEGREVLARILRAHHLVWPAKNGDEAVDRARDQEPDVVIVDATTALDVAQLCRVIKADTGPLAGTQLLVITRTAAETKAAGIVDADDRLERPFRSADLASRVRNLVRLRQQARNFRATFAALEEREARITADLKQASDLVRRMMQAPERIPGIEIDIAHRPRNLVGGDLYDVSVLDDTLVRILLVHTPGQSMRASLAAMVVKTEYEIVKRASVRSAPVLSALNDRVARAYGQLDMGFAASIVTIDRHANLLRYARAGTPSPLVLHDGAFTTLPSDANLIGREEGVAVEEHMVEFNVGDALYLFTAGAIEERGPSAEAFGYDGLRQAILQANGEGKSAAATVERWVDEFAVKAEKDLTFIAVRRV